MKATNNAPSPIRPDEAERLDAAMAHLRKHFASGPRLADVAKLAGMSPFYFHRRFRAHFGTTPKGVETSLRVEQAMRYIVEGMPLAEVARQCGFASQTYFGKRFKAVAGHTPATWRRQALQAKRQQK